MPRSTPTRRTRQPEPREAAGRYVVGLRSREYVSVIDIAAAFMREDREETPESVAQLLRKLEALGYIEVIGGMARMLRDIDA